ncbi:MAG: hypothetical protein ACE5D8_04045 [Fidelibacterota bacterium]
MKYLSFLMLLLLISCQKFPWSEAAFEDVLAQAGDRLVLAEFYTDW